MAVKYTNNAKTTLASGLTNSATSASVTDGSVFPSLGAGEYFYITFDDGSNNEIAKVTARSGNTLTIVRAQDNTSARAFSTGDSAELRVIAAVLTEIQENIAAKSANQTVYSATAASNATDYNIGVDPGVEANASVFLDGVYQHHDTFSFSGSTLTFDAAPTNGTKIEVVVDNLINLQSSNLTVDTFTATSGQTAFTLSDAPGGESNVLAFIDGVFQNQASFTLSSNTLTFDTGVVVGRSVTVYIINPVNIGTPSDNTVTSAKLSGNITLPGSLTVGAYDVAFDSPTFVVDNANSRVGIGTASPSTGVLDIVGDVTTSSHINIGGNLIKGSGNLTLDVAGNIVLDADGDHTVFSYGASGEVGRVSNESENLVIYSLKSDKDLKFNGVDGSSTITALTLDMSEAGAATFNSTISSGAITATGINSTAGTVQFTDGGSTFDSSDSNGYSHFTQTNGSAQIGFSRTGNSAGTGYIGADSSFVLNVYDSSFAKKASISTSGDATFTGTITSSDILIESTGKLRIGTDQTWASNVSGQIRLAYDGDERSITGSYDDGMVIRTNSYQLKLATDGVLHIPGNVQSAGAVIVGGTAVDQAGTISLQTDGDIRGVLTSGAGGDTIISAISGVSNGYQITVDSSNNQTYKWHNGGAASMTLNSSGKLGIGMTPGSYGMLQVALSTNDSYSAGSFLDFPTVTLQHTAGDGYYGGIRLTNTSGNYEWFMGTTQVASNQADFVWQGYNRTAGAYQEMMRLTDDSKLGIGTTDPSAPIHIQTNTAETDDGVTGLMLTALSTGTTIAGFGPRLQFQAERNNGVNQNVGLLSFLASTNSGTNISSDFVVHCGTAGVNNERFRVRHDGGEATIKAPTTNAYYPYLQLRNYSSGAYSGRINFWTKNSGVEWVAASIFTTGGSGYQSGSLSGGMRLYVRGQFGDSLAINAIDINGNTGVASGDFNDTSDVALKKDVVSLDGAESLKAIKALNPVSFKWKLDDRESSGFIAQEVEKHLPNDVVGEDWKAEDAEKDEEGSKGKAINTAGILAHAVKVIQDQQVIIDDLKSRIEALE